MIIGVGVDTIEVSRIEALLRKDPERALARLFTSSERDLCGARVKPGECYAARFAAKEAFLKALGTGLSEGIRWTDVEVIASPRKKPELLLSGRALETLGEAGASTIHLSFTHEAGVATALVVLES